MRYRIIEDSGGGLIVRALTGPAKGIIMVTNPTGNFRNEALYNADRQAVDFILDFQHDEKRKAITCRVSREALEDRAGTSGEIPLLSLYEQYRPEVWTAVDRHIKRGHFEPDGSILVRTGEVQPL